MSTTRHAPQAGTYSLDGLTGLRLHAAAAEPAVLHGRKGLRLTMPADLTARAAAAAAPADLDQLAIVDGLDFSNGVIEAEIAGGPARAPARGPAVSSDSPFVCSRT